MSQRESDGSDHELHEYLRQAVTRRGFVTRTALGAGALAFGGGFLASCSGKEAGKAGAPAAAGGETKTLRISNWPLYIDKQTVPDFEKATGIKVEYTEDVNDNNEFFAKVRNQLGNCQSVKRDMFMLTDWMAARMIALGWIQPLDAKKEGQSDHGNAEVPHALAEIEKQRIVSALRRTVGDHQPYDQR